MMPNLIKKSWTVSNRNTVIGWDAWRWTCVISSIHQVQYKLGLAFSILDESRTSEADGRNSNQMFISPMDIMKDDLGISKIIEISLTNLNDIDLRS